MKKWMARIFPHMKKVEDHLAAVESDIVHEKAMKKESKNIVIAKNEKLHETIRENHFTIYITGATGRKMRGAKS